jgi:hypothetical protein
VQHQEAQYFVSAGAQAVREMQARPAVLLSQMRRRQLNEHGALRLAGRRTRLSGQLAFPIGSFFSPSHPLRVQGFALLRSALASGPPVLVRVMVAVRQIFQLLLQVFSPIARGCPSCTVVAEGRKHPEWNQRAKPAPDIRASMRLHASWQRSAFSRRLPD